MDCQDIQELKRRNYTSKEKENKINNGDHIQFDPGLIVKRDRKDQTSGSVNIQDDLKWGGCFGKCKVSWTIVGEFLKINKGKSWGWDSSESTLSPADYTFKRMRS